MAGVDLGVFFYQVLWLCKCACAHKHGPNLSLSLHSSVWSAKQLYCWYIYIILSAVRALDNQYHTHKKKYWRVEFYCHNFYKHVVNFCPGGTNIMWASLMDPLRSTIWCVHDKLTYHDNWQYRLLLYYTLCIHAYACARIFINMQMYNNSYCTQKRDTHKS